MLRRGQSSIGVRRVVNIARGGSFTRTHSRHRLPPKISRPKHKVNSNTKLAKVNSNTKLSRVKVKEPKGEKPKKTAGGKSKEMAELLELSRTMTNVFSKSVDSLSKLSHDAVSTATAMKALAETQSGRGAELGYKQGTPGTYYDKLGFMGGNTGAPLTRDYLESKAQQLVEIKVVFLRIHDIDTVNQVYDAEIYIQARWRERRFLGYSETVLITLWAGGAHLLLVLLLLGHTTPQALADIEFYQCTDPCLKILNVVGELDMEKTSMVLRYEPDSFSPVLVYMWHVKGIFRERMELDHFPFDVQELSIVISTEQPIGVVELAGDFGRASCINMGALEACQDWSSYMHVEVTRDVTTRETSGVSSHSVLVVSARVKRNLGFYFWNIALLVFMIEGMTFVFLAVDPVGSTRLSLSVSLFFTAVAYKLVVKNSLPNISYLTYLDVYIGFVMAYLFLWAAINSLLSHLARYRERQRVMEIDQIAQSCLVGFLALFHILFLIYIQFTALARRRQMNKLDAQYKLAKLMRQGHLSRPMFRAETDRQTALAGLQTTV